MKQFAVVALLVALLVSALQFPQRVIGFALPILPLARLWFDADAQHALAMRPAPYAQLREANALLPTNARVLLVTDGRDARYREYVTFHRALYVLTPRAIVWVSPAPHDGTWESKWLPAPLTAESLNEIAARHDVDYFFLLAPMPVGLRGEVVRVWHNGALVKLQTRAEGVVPARRDAVGLEGIGGIAVALLLISGIGALAAQFIARGYFVSSLESIAIHFVLGTGIVSLLLWFALVRGISLEAACWILVLPAAFGIFNMARMAWRARKIPSNFARPLWEWLALVWLTLQIFFVGWIALAQPLTYWDSWVAWGIKARTIFFTQTLSSAVHADATRSVTHLDYPLLLPLTEAFLFQWLGAADDRWIGILAVGFFLGLLASMFYGVSRLTGNRLRAWLATLVVGSLPGITLLAATMFADVPLAGFALVGTLALVEYLERENKGALGIALVSLGFLPWLKREGWILLGAVLVSMVLLAPRDGRTWRAFGSVLVGALFGAGSWYVFVAAHNVSNSDFLPLTWQTFSTNLDRVPTIAGYFAGELLNAQWSFVTVLGLLAVFVYIRAHVTNLARVLAPRAIFFLAPLLYLGAMASVYLFSAYLPLSAHLASSGYRLIAQVVPLLVVWLALGGHRTESVASGFQTFDEKDSPRPMDLGHRALGRISHTASVSWNRLARNE